MSSICKHGFDLDEDFCQKCEDALNEEHPLTETKPCGNPDCSVSTAIDEETLTFGSGELLAWGHWSHPCNTCAYYYKSENPSCKVWPDPKLEDEEYL